ncbi:MAG: hypothetical protein ACLQBD_13620 [Syntrophobacteraceae bacterium]
MRDCSVRGCTGVATSRFGSMCEQHRQRQRRHGDARQESIRAIEVKPYVMQVEKIVERDGSGKILAGLEKVVDMIRTYADGITSDYAHGRAMNKHRVQAAQEVLTVFRDFTALQCGSVVAGMYLLQDANSHRFASDKGFTFELVRRFRSLSDANVGLYENADSGKVRRAYREIPPRTVGQLGAILVDGFKTFVAFVRIHERKQAERVQEARNLLQEGFAEIDHD